MKKILISFILFTALCFIFSDNVLAATDKNNLIYDAALSSNSIELNDGNSFIFDGSSNLNIGLFADFIKVVNMTDYSYRLKDGEVLLEEDMLIVSKEYLYTLEGNNTYSFRVVTETEFIDFDIVTDFTSSTLTSDKSEYTNEDNIVLTMEGASKVVKVYLDGMSFTDYVVNTNTITIDKKVINTLINGNHIITVFTDKGRPTIDINIVEASIYIEEEVEANHIFFYVDIAIFAAMIVGYTALTLISKRKEGRVNE